MKLGLLRFLFSIGLIVLVAVIDVLLASALSHTMLLVLIDKGVDRYIATGSAIIVAILSFGYLAYRHKLVKLKYKGRNDE